MARDEIPGENDFSNIMDPMSVHDRTIRVIVQQVEPSDGFVTVDFDGSGPSAGRYASLPWLWCSFPSPNTEGDKLRGAWGRYAPFNGDIMKASFDWDDTIHIVGYDAKFFGSNVADGTVGWSQITAASKGDDPIMLSQFRELKSGEYDFMSIGGAYVFGADDGQLHLEGGPAQIDLIKSSNSFSGMAQCWKSTAELSTLRYGQVRRFSPTPTPFGVGEIAMPPWNPTGSYVEHQIYLQQNVQGVGLPVIRHALGNVTTEPSVGGGAPDISTITGQMKRFALDIFDAGGATTVYSDEVDMLGSQSVSAQLATQYNVDYPVGTVSFSSLSASYSTTADTTMDARTTFDITVGTNYSVTTDAGNIQFDSALNFNAKANLNIDLKATAAFSAGGSTLSLSGGGTSISMMGGGIVKMGGGASPAVNFNQLSQSFTAAQLAFDSTNPALMTTLGAIMAPGLSGSAVVAALAAIITYIDSVAAAINASSNPQVMY